MFVPDVLGIAPEVSPLSLVSIIALVGVVIVSLGANLTVAL